MPERSSDHHIPAPCIIETGILVSKRDMLRLLGDLTQVRYVELLNGEPQPKGKPISLKFFLILIRRQFWLIIPCISMWPVLTIWS